MESYHHLQPDVLGFISFDISILFLPFCLGDNESYLRRTKVLVCSVWLIIKFGYISGGDGFNLHREEQRCERSNNQKFLGYQNVLPKN